MNREHSYAIEVRWTGNRGGGTSDYRTYGRDHIISAPGKAELHASSDPAFRGDPTKYNPEELFLASLSACHMLWYLHLCADEGITVISYSDSAEGTMKEESDGGGRFTEVVLKPRVRITDEAMIGLALELHEKANKFCFIAASCNFPVSHRPECTAG